MNEFFGLGRLINDMGGGGNPYGPSSILMANPQDVQFYQSQQAMNQMQGLSGLGQGLQGMRDSEAAALSSYYAQLGMVHGDLRNAYKPRKITQAEKRRDQLKLKREEAIKDVRACIIISSFVIGITIVIGVTLGIELAAIAAILVTLLCGFASFLYIFTPILISKYANIQLRK